MHPVAEMSLALLQHPTAVELCAIGAALGLVQNFAALYALVTDRIQQGHMRLHNRRLALSGLKESLAKAERI